MQKMEARTSKHVDTLTVMFFWFQSQSALSNSIGCLISIGLHRMQDACKLYMLKLYHAENGSPNIGRPTHKIFQVGSWVDSQKPVNCTCSNTIMHSGSLNIGRHTQNVSQVGSWNGTPEACELHKLKLYYALRKPVHREAHTKSTSNKISNLKDNCAVTWGCVCGEFFVTIRAMYSPSIST